MRIDIGEWQVRSFYLEDAEALAKYANNRNVWLNLRDAHPLPYRLEHAVSWLRMATRQWPEVHFAIATADEAIGYIGLGLQSDVFLPLGGDRILAGRAVLGAGASPPPHCRPSPSTLSSNST